MITTLLVLQLNYSSNRDVKDTTFAQILFMPYTDKKNFTNYFVTYFFLKGHSRLSGVI